MAYLAFYRMFRPTKLEEVVRQENVVKILKNQIMSGKIGHAYLFCGPRGTGKTTIAKIFARAINCEHPVNGSPCGVCPTCRAIEQGGNLDVSEIDAASNNGVDEIRDIREKVQYPPVAGKYKVYIIDEVHMLSSQAFNAFLKCLEEPPTHAVFILATTEPQKIPATILSRCMRFDFKLIPQADLEKLICRVFDKVGKEYEKEAVSAIARAGAGSARDSLSVADMCASYTTGKLTYNDVNDVLGSADFYNVAEIVESILSENVSLSLSSIENALATGKGVGVLLRDLLQLLNNVAIAKMCKNAREIVNVPEEMFNRISTIAGKADGHKILRVTEILSVAESDMRYALNGRILLETAVIKCAMPMSDYNIDALIGRMATIERKLEEGIKIATTQAVNSQPLPNVNSSEAKPFAQNGRQTEATQTEREAQNSTSQAQYDIDFNDILYGLEPPPDDNWTAYMPQPTEFLPTSVPENRTTATQRGQSANGLNTPNTTNSSNTTNTPNTTSSSSGKTQPSVNTPSNGIKPSQTQMNVADNTNSQRVQGTSSVNSQAQTANGGVMQGTSVASELDNKTTFRMLLKALRTQYKNAVVFTLCMDAETEFEGDTFVLKTDSEVIYKGLTRDDNKSFLDEVFKSIGINSHAVRLVQKGENAVERGLKDLKDVFGNDLKIKP